METINPPAFPSVEKQPGEEFDIENLGMSLRDHFAGLAMQNLVPIFHDKWQVHRMDKLAEQAYLMADAMLKQRLKPINE